MKRFAGIVMLLILCGLHLYAQKHRQDAKDAAVKDFLIDSSKPYVYLELDHIGPSHRYPQVLKVIYAIGANASNSEAGQANQVRENRPDEDIYLRLRNNCRIPIVVFTASILLEKPGARYVGPHPDSLSWVKDEVASTPGYGVEPARMWEVRPIRLFQFEEPSSPLLLDMPDVVLSPGLTKAKAQILEEEQRKAEETEKKKQAEITQKKAEDEAEANELLGLLTRDLHLFSQETTIPPGMEIYFAVPMSHVSEKWHFGIPFQFDLKTIGPIRQPYGYAPFYWYDLPREYTDSKRKR